MAATELQRAHLHPLTFALDPLEARSSLELALVPFHLDNDEPGFDAVVDRARYLWLNRRHRGIEASGTGHPPRPPRPPPAAPSRGAVPEVFVPLVQAVRTVALKQNPPSCSSVGVELLKISPQIYKSGSYQNFKTLRLDAQKRGITEFIKGQQKGGGGDYMRLTSEFQDVVLSPSMPPAPVVPPPPRTHTADDFHLASLDFDPSLDDLAALPTHHVLLLQFRDDIQVPPHEEVERVFWRRRTIALERGEELLPAVVSAPRFLPRASSPRGGGLAGPSHNPSSPGISRALAPPPPLPALDEPLPPSVYDPLHALEILYLPPDTVPTIPHLLALFPPHLVPLVSILNAPSSTPIASTATTPSSTVVARSAYIAFPSSALATEAHAHLNGLRVPSSIGGGGEWSLWAGALLSGVRPRWQWGDVRPEEREGLWRNECEQRAREERRASEDQMAREADEAVKRRREEGAGVDARGGSPKRQKVKHVNETVAPSDRVPPHLLDSLFPATLAWVRCPKGLNVLDMSDDAFVWRFHAVAWAEKPSSSGFELLFSSAKDRDAFDQWIKLDAKRYWKTNGLVVHHLPSAEAARSPWRFADLSPSFRRQHGIVLDPAAVASARTQVVGELGEGPDPPPGAPSFWRAGWFDYEYIMHGRKPPLRPPVTWRSDTSSLASRLGGIADDKVPSRGTASRRASRGDDTLAASSARHAPASLATPSRAPASNSKSFPTRPTADLAPGDVDADFYLEPFSPYSPLIDADPFASMASPASPSSTSVDDPFDSPISPLDDDDDDDVAISTSLFAAARSFHLPPPRDADDVKGPRVDAIALSDFADELDCAMVEAAQLFGTAVEQDEVREQEDIEMGDEQTHERLEQPAVEPGRAVGQGLEMDVDVDEAATEADAPGTDTGTLLSSPIFPPSSSSTSAPSLTAPSLSLAERLSPRAPGRASKSSPRREAAMQAALQSEPV
ncbi:hypothetical protein JCM3775_002374 [Rhodotorula graminis]